MCLYLIAMAKKTAVFYLLVFSSGLQACNPDPNSTSSLQTTLRRHPVSASTPLSVGQLAPTETERMYTTFSDEYSPNCHNNNNEDDLIDKNVGSNATAHAYQHIVVSGLPFKRGESHGLQAKEKIQKAISFYKAATFMPAWGDCIQFVRTNYMEALQQYYPNGLEEMKGISVGAGVQLDDILVLNSRYELIRWKHSQKQTHESGALKEKARASDELPECKSKEISFETTTPKEYSTTIPDDNNIYDNDEAIREECTGAVALASSTKYAHVLLGQNWDTNEFVLTNDTAILLEVYPDPCENIKPFVMLTEAGQLGNFGMNADGLGVVSMSLSSSSDTFQTTTERGWIPSNMLKRMFLEAPNFSMGLLAIRHTPIHVSVNMIIATADDEALNIELTPGTHFTTQISLEKEFFAHSNHFKSASFSARNDIREESMGKSSLFRDRRVAKHLMNSWPRITEDTFQTAFKDHVGHPSSVCAHSVHNDMSWTAAYPRKTTVASIIFNLSQRTLQLSKGPPCVKVYKNYCFKFSQL